MTVPKAVSPNRRYEERLIQLILADGDPAPHIGAKRSVRVSEESGISEIGTQTSDGADASEICILLSDKAPELCV
jgi:hypothetical protein